MVFLDFWRIETPYGYVELELDEAGGPLTDERDIDETQKVCSMLAYGIKNRDPRITKAIVEIYAQFHPERFPPGIAIDRLETRDIDPLRPALIGFLETQVEAGFIRLFDDEIVMAKVEHVEKIVYTPQPIVPETTTFIGVRLEDEEGQPISGTRLRLHLPDGDVQERTTNSKGEVYIDGIAVDGMARVEFLDLDEEAVASLPSAH